MIGIVLHGTHPAMRAGVPPLRLSVTPGPIYADVARLLTPLGMMEFRFGGQYSYVGIHCYFAANAEFCHHRSEC
jgi:hypothetical protein